MLDVTMHALKLKKYLFDFIIFNTLFALRYKDMFYESKITPTKRRNVTVEVVI